ncbi:hypothetical protein [Mycobacteroides immunogenum]|uniref:Uncharacterized protein n=1 Tax=Mycobacteroides immunogenum TaxID=83262 RepID=A0ABR5LJR0_9MYCO|nr:hypothetical protein [Mycobacteroides immunogenum]KPG25855.1 hypothetical protein AN912_26260 [Mycobacteroides immunogenum]KPG26285.1 hypothetical protein AN913_21200 [Mycobacteroides immunogenum]KPG29724.1 hypothetical protein AN914_27245 [Mycobacteroides immunogenum]KPG38527.1 hypothetical protein AN915_27635 [Mycobacteroides immunogenum]KPG56175.1 hypothetical protein AN918_27890 [Mycobacteroides immunogenum]
MAMIVDPIGAAVAAVLAAGALYRSISGLRGTFTAGLWVASVSMAISAAVIPLDAALKSVTGLDNLSQLVCYSGMVISSYLIAHTTYRLAAINPTWPIVYTAVSIAGMLALYCATELRHTQTLAIETVPGAASAWFAIFYALGLLPTHIAAIIGVAKAKHKDTAMIWLLGTYGAVGAINPAIIVGDHIGTHTLRWPLSVTYPLVWVVLFISFAALSAAGIIAARRKHTDGQPVAEVASTVEPARAPTTGEQDC